MPGQRKLFLAHAGELAHLLVRTLGRTAAGFTPAEGLVTRFLRSYALRFNRPGRLNNPERALELESTITREALLVAAIDIRHRLPRAFAPGRAAAPGSPEAALADSFFAEFLASLGRSLEWRPSEARAEQEAFRHDLEMYQRWTHRSASRSRHAEDSPFPDRCALLLDPAMMEQARRAAAEFESEILRAVARIFAHLGVESREPSRRAARSRRRSLSPKRRRNTSRMRSAPARRRRARKPRRTPPRRAAARRQLRRARPKKWPKSAGQRRKVDRRRVPARRSSKPPGRAKAAARRRRDRHRKRPIHRR